MNKPIHCCVSCWDPFFTGSGLFPWTKCSRTGYQFSALNWVLHLFAGLFHPGRACTALHCSPSWTRSSLLCMCTCLWFFPLFLLISGFELVTLGSTSSEFSEHCHHFSLSEKGAQKKACSSTVSLAPSSSGHQDFVNISTGLYQEHFSFAPQQRSQAPSPNQRRDVQQESRECRLDVRQLPKTQSQECVVLRPLWLSMGRLYHLPDQDKADTLIIQEILLDRTGSATMGRSSWRSKPTTESQEEQEQKQGQGQRKTSCSAGSTCPSSSTAAFWARRTATAAVDEHAPSSRSFHLTSNVDPCGTATARSVFSFEESQSGNPHSGASTTCCQRDQSCQQKGRQDALFRCGCSHKSTGRAGHSTPSQEQSYGAMESIPDYVIGAFSPIHRPFSKSGTSSPGKHQAGQGEIAQGEGRFQLQRRGSHADLGRRIRDQTHIDQRIGHSDSGRTQPHDGEPSEAFRASRARTGRRRKEGQKATPERGRSTRRCNAIRKFAFYATFWWARPLMTLEYFDQWAALPPTRIDAAVAKMQWSHSILQEPNYLSPWQASENALHLAFTLQPNSLIHQCEQQDWGFSVPRKQCRKGRTVSFDPLAYVHFGPESSSIWTTSRVPTAEVSLRDWLPKSSKVSQSTCKTNSTSFASSSASPRTNRPDLTENPNLPDPPSSSEGSGEGGQPRRPPIRHLPAWVNTLWNLLQDEGATELLEEGPVIYLDTFYLSHRNCIRQAASRAIRLNRRYEEWQEEFKLIWGDIFDQEAAYELFLVQPEPPISITRGISGIVLIVQHAQPGGAAILTSTQFDELPTPRMLEIAHVLDIWTDYTTILHRAEAFEACREAERQGQRPCVLRTGPHVFPRERPIRVADGLGLVISVPLIIDDEAWDTYVQPRIEEWPEFVQRPQAEDAHAHDETNLMARKPIAHISMQSSSSSSTSSTEQSSTSIALHESDPPWHRTVILAPDGTMISTPLPAVSMIDQLRHIEHALGASPGDVAMAFTVATRPDDLIEMDLLCTLIIHARQPRPHTFMRLILLDLEIFEENDILPGTFQRSARWVPHTTTRLSLLRILGLENVFLRYEANTRLWINNVLFTPQVSEAATIEDGDYIQIVIGNIDSHSRCEGGQEEMAFLQTTITYALKKIQMIDVPQSNIDVCSVHDHDSNPNSDEQPNSTSFSFTDEFLRAVDAVRTAADAMPEFPEDDPGDITAYDIWVQQLYDAWARSATIGPGGMERLGRVETWFTDHTNFQRCHHTRIAVLGPDAHRWEEQLRHLWRQYLIPDAPLEFHLVDPLPDDATGQIIGQLILVQRAHVYQRSVIISTYDSGYDQGRAHSTAVVMGTRVDLHSVCTMMQAHEDCPPDNPGNRCTLWAGTRLMAPLERVYARHGSLFKLYIQRALQASAAATTLTNLQERMQVLDTRATTNPRQRPLSVLPLWLQSLHRVFQDLAETERPDEGPVAYVATWYLHASYAPRCDPGRIVRLRDDSLNWQRTLIEAWGDRRDSSRPADFFWVTPAPPTSLTDHVLGHILIVQSLPVHSAAVLLTARVRDREGQTLRRAAVCVPQASSAEDIVAAFPIPGPLLRYPRRVGRGQTFFDPNVPTQVASGEGLVIDIIDAIPVQRTPPDGDGLSMLQHQVQRRQTHSDSPVGSQGGCLTVGQVAHTQRPSSPPTALPISLDDNIPAAPQVQVDFTAVKRILESINGSLNEFSQPWPDTLEIPSITQEALVDLLTDVPDEAPRAFHFYTDGSKIPEGAVGAGVVLLLEHSQGLSYGGALCKVISLEGHAGVGENGAVVWALLWAIQLSNHTWYRHGVSDPHFYFHFDALNAGYLAGGYFRTKQFPQHRTLMRSLAHILQSRHGFSRLHWWHVKAHAGNPWNELADAIAKFASHNPDIVPHSEVWHEWLQDHEKLLAIQWVWYLEHMEAASAFVPQMQDGFLTCRLTPVPCPSHMPEPENSGSLSAAPRVSIQIDITIATANVLTLHQDTSHKQGTSISRQFVLMQQFHDAGCVFVGIQETRHKHLVGVNNPWYHVLGHAATSQGQDGVQLWISSCFPLYTSGRPIRKEHISLVFSCPTTLIAKINDGTWKCVIVTSRAPHSGRQRQEAQSHWNIITATLHRKAAGWPVFYCGDANAHVGECPTTAIGELAAVQENQAGEIFHHWLLTHNLKLPATFAESHPGTEHNSYYTPDGKHGTRIDYIAIPQEIEYQKLHSRVAEDIDLCAQRPDHHAVLCQVSFAICAPQPRQVRPTPKWDSHHLGQQLQHEEALFALHSAIPPASWHTDPHAAAQQLALHTNAALHQITQSRRLWKRKNHITDETWHLVERKKLTFKQLRQLTRTWRYTMLQACFASWKATSSSCTALTRNFCHALQQDLPQWLRLHDHAVAQTSWFYHQVGQQTKQAILKEDTAYYQHLADQAAHTYSIEGLTSVWKHFRAILPKNRGKRNVIQHDLGDSLNQHFQELEAGLPQELSQLQQLCAERNNKELARQPSLQSIALAELPTLVEIEDHCLKQKPHKAPGPDGIPSSLCRAGSAAIAPQLHALICKSFLLGIEPFPHKGGHLCALFKHKGNRDDASAYRGILLSDSFAKITHAWARQRLLPTLQARRTLGQLGGLPSQQTLTGIQILKLHGNVSKAAQLSTCTLFLDLRSAFHHLLRELVFLTSDGLTQQDLAQIFNQDDFDIQTLVRKLAELSSAAPQDIPPGLRRFLHDIHHQTWFQLRNLTATQAGKCTHTRRGSRPGSPLADIAFNLMMSGFLQDLHTALLNNESCMEGSRALGVTIPPVAWMDDVAIPLTTATPEALVPLVQQVTATVHTLFRERGLTLNLDKGKTEAVLCFRGPGSDAMRLKLFDTERQPIIVVKTESHILTLRVVPSYKHLGALYSMNVDVGREIRARIGSARQAFEEMKKPLFVNKRLSVEARLKLFNSLILSRLFYGCAVWTDIPNALAKKLESTLIAYYRQIYDVGFWQPVHITDDSFRRANRLPTFRQIWARHKLTFLQHVAQHGIGVPQEPTFT